MKKGFLFNKIDQNLGDSIEGSESDSRNKVTIKWDDVLKRLEEKSNPQVYFWFSSLKLVEKENDTLTLKAKTNFDRDWIENHYLDFIKETLVEIYSSNFTINLVSEQSDHNTKTQIASRQHRKSPKYNVKNSGFVPFSGYLNPNYSFESFIVGSSNQFAHAASIAAAQKPGEAYNPLFIYGGVGLGKTHLINAIGNHVIRNPDTSPRVCCISAEHFTNQVINGIKTNKMEDFRNRYRFGCDLLLIDDIQFIAGKESTQEEFFHTFNTLYEFKKQIVLTSDKHPNEMSYFEERLRSRFEWGLIADIQPPEIETRVAIIRQKAESEGIELPNEVAIFIAQNSNSNIRELEGSLNNIVAHSKLLNTKISIDLAKQVLKILIRKREKKVTTVESIQKEVATFFEIKVSDLKSNRKQKNIATPRQIAMFLARKYTVASYPELGEKFGGKDHSTVIHAVRKIENILGKDVALTNSINSISRKIDSDRD